MTWQWPHRTLAGYSMLPPTLDWPKAYARLLDACMGWVEPFMTELAGQRGYRLTVCDIEPRGPLVERQDIRKLTYKDKVFRGVISIDTIEHVMAPEAVHALREFRRVTEPGGFLILGVPIEIVANGLKRRKSEPLVEADSDHHWWLPGLDVLEMVCECGYRHIGTVESMCWSRMHASVIWLLEREG